MSEKIGCMNCGNISCGNNKKRESAGCGRYIRPEDKIKELEKENTELKGIRDVATLIRANNDTVITLMQLNNTVITLMQLNNKLVSKSQQLTKAREIILRLYNAGRDVLMCRAEEKAYDNLSNAINDKSIGQFLSEVEK